MVSDEQLKKLYYCLEKSNRTVELATIKLAEETGEVSEAVLATSNINNELNYKNKTIDDVCEECIDVIICAVSIMILKNNQITNQYIYDGINKKLNKWISIQQLEK